MFAVMEHGGVRGVYCHGPLEVWKVFTVMEPGGVYCHGAWRCGICLLSWSLEVWEMFAVMEPGGVGGVCCHGAWMYGRCLLSGDIFFKRIITPLRVRVWEASLGIYIQNVIECPPPSPPVSLHNHSTYHGCERDCLHVYLSDVSLHIKCLMKSLAENNRRHLLVMQIIYF